MNSLATSHSRYWEPDLDQVMGVSLLAGTIATAITYPMEYLKTVIQFRSTAIGFRGHNPWYQGYNPFKIMREMNTVGKGFSIFYQGFDAHLAGRLLYLGLRNVFYKTIYDSVKPFKLHNDLTIVEKSMIAGSAGGVAALFTSPFSLISIRQILDSQLPLQFRRNYASIADGFKLAGKQLFNGLGVHVFKHVILNIALTYPYDRFKEHFFTRFGEYPFVDPAALSLAAFVGAAVTLPIDNIRTKLMQEQIQHPERNRFVFKQSVIKALLLSANFEGNSLSLWAGFYTYYASTFLYALLTVGISDAFLTSWKKKAGLLQWQM